MKLTANTLTATALGGIGGAGLASCMTLAPRTTLGLACITAALCGGANIHHNRLADWAEFNFNQSK